MVDFQINLHAPLKMVVKAAPCSRAAPTDSHPDPPSIGRPGDAKDQSQNGQTQLQSNQSQPQSGHSQTTEIDLESVNRNLLIKVKEELQSAQVGIQKSHQECRQMAIELIHQFVEELFSSDSAYADRLMTTVNDCLNQFPDEKIIHVQVGNDSVELASKLFDQSGLNIKIVENAALSGGNCIVVYDQKEFISDLAVQLKQVLTLIESEPVLESGGKQ